MWSNSVAGTNDRLTSIVVLEPGEWGTQEGIDSALLAKNGTFEQTRLAWFYLAMKDSIETRTDVSSALEVAVVEA